MFGGKKRDKLEVYCLVCFALTESGIFHIYLKVVSISTNPTFKVK